MVGCAGVASIAGCIESAQNGINELHVEPTSVDESPLTAAWSIDLPGQYTLSAPAADESHVYIGSRQEVFAVRKRDGGIDWGVDIGALTHGFSPAFDGHTVYGASRDILGHQRIVDRANRPDLLDIDEDPDGPGVTALTAASGEALWKAEIPVSGSPVIRDDMIFVPIVDELTGVVALASDSGNERWFTSIDGPDIFATPVVTDGIIVSTVGDADGHSKVVALDEDGDEQWRLDLVGEAYKGPATANGAIFIGTDRGHVYCIEEDGEIRWEREVDAGVYTTPAVTTDRVFVTAIHTVKSLDRETGESLWNAGVDHVERTGMALGGNMIHIGGNEIASFPTDGTDGGWRVTLPGAGGTFGTPFYDDEVLYSGACIKLEGVEWYDHLLFALALPN